MEIGELYRRICSVTTRFDFLEPVETVDLNTFEHALREALTGPRADARFPDGYTTAIATVTRGVQVEVFFEGRCRYRRVMLCGVTDTPRA